MAANRRRRAPNLLLADELLTSNQKWSVIAGIVLGYVLVFPIAYPFIEHFYFIFGLFPIVASGVLLGFWPAIYSVLLVSVIQFGILVLGVDTSLQTALLESIPLVTLLIGGTVGYLRDLQVRLARQQEELSTQNERLDKFASLVSHDLRNPLTVAQGRIDLTRQDCDSEHLENAADEIDRSLTMINELLTLAREGETIAEFETLDLDVVVDTCWEIVEDEQATLNTDTLPLIKADRSRLRQLLENLFRNAVDHGGENVTVTVGELDGGFFVEDDGSGIPEDDRNNVFETGFSTAEQGTGFGLAIVQEIATAHGWSITVTAGSEGGARFEITGVEFPAA